MIRLVLFVCLLAAAVPAAPALRVTTTGSETQLALGERGAFRSTPARVLEPRCVPVPGTPQRLVLWQEQVQEFQPTSWYAISLDGETVARVRQTDYLIHLRRATFDPRVAPPNLSSSPLGRDHGQLYLVQYLTQPLETFGAAIRAAGGRVYGFVPLHTRIVWLPPGSLTRVASLPFVRWVGPYHPEYRLEPVLLEGLRDGTLTGAGRYYIQVLERGPAQQQQVANRLQGLGGVVHGLTPQGFRFQATLSPELLARVVTWDEVLYVDRWSAPEPDMDIVRQVGGADYLEAQTGYTGQGLRAEVMDGNVRASHLDFQSDPIIFHGSHGGSSSHGTSTTGIVFGDGAANPAGRGMLPDGQPVFADYDQVSNRYTHTAELLGPTYECVFQSNSWGGSRTTIYTTTSMEMDDIIFQLDFLICQSQSNAGDQMSRPQAWAKNILSVGGVYHHDTATLTDDEWNYSASIGPAEDGRIKPDLCYFYDSIRAPTSSSDTAYTQFGGTSAATPMTAGHAGLFQQMWSAGIFGNPTPGATIFANRPHCTTTKAALICTASQYDFSGTGHDLTRVHQGWGRANVQTLYDLRNRIFIVDEANPLPNLGSITYPLWVTAGEPELRATLVYIDWPGTTSAAQHRVNDLSLRVTSPTGTIYLGNVGLDVGVWSVPGGSPDTLNTVECVFIPSPDPGFWSVEVLADEVNQDTHVETGSLDADFALVVTGVDDALLGCSITEPPAPASGDLTIAFDTFSMSAATVDCSFEYTTDGGTSFLPCTAAASSPVPNPATGQPTGPDDFVWDPRTDGLGVSGVTAGARVRLSVDDGVTGIPASCSTLPFDVLPVPPACTMAGPTGVASDEIQVQLDSSSPNGPTVNLIFEFSLDGGFTYAPCTAAASSPLPSAATGIPTGPATFAWDSTADGVGLLAVATGVRVRALVDDLISPLLGECSCATFDVDNVPPSPTCTVATPAGLTHNDVSLDFWADSQNAAVVDLFFQYSLDGGVTFLSCATAGTSPVGNPALGQPLGAGRFVWNSLLDHAAEAQVESGVVVRVTVSDGIAPVPGSCSTSTFSMDNRPPRCTVTVPSGPAWGGVPVVMDTESSHGLTVYCHVEHSTDAGGSWTLSAAASWSAVLNPSQPIPAGPATFVWDSRQDGVGLTAPVAGVLVRAECVDGIALGAGTCTSAPFEVDNTQLCGGICGDCNESGTGPDILDALLAAQLAAGIMTPTANQAACCDVNRSGSVNVVDALRMAQASLGLAVGLDCP